MHSRVLLAAFFVVAAQGQLNAVTAGLSSVDSLIATISDSTPQVAVATGSAAASSSVDITATQPLLATDSATVTLSHATGTAISSVSGSSTDLDGSSAVPSGVFASTTASGFFTPTGASVTAPDSTTGSLSSPAVTTSTISVFSTTSASNLSITSTTLSTKAASTSTTSQSTSTSTGGAAATEVVKYAGLVVVAGLAMAVL